MPFILPCASSTVNTAKSFIDLGLESEMVICSLGLFAEPPEIVKMSSANLASDDLALNTFNRNVSVVLAPDLSVPRITTSRLPRSDLVGLPLKVRSLALNFNQGGKSLPFFSAAA